MAYFKLRPVLMALLFVMTISAAAVGSVPNEKKVLAAMRKASDFMADTGAYRGGYLYYYSADLKELWGEAPARPTQIWVQETTTGVGEMFLEAYELTDDDTYLKYAERAANALIYGQHPLGGWHYFIDFDMPGLEKWYRDVFSQFK